MEHNSLYDLIQNIEYGTHLHIGVLFFNNFENEKCFLPHSHRIHCSTVCDEIKQNKKEYRRCFGCRNLAIKKALSTKAPFGGVCINGLYVMYGLSEQGQAVFCKCFGLSGGILF